MILGIDSMVKDHRNKKTVRGEEMLGKLQWHNEVRFCIKGRKVRFIFINSIELNLMKFFLLISG